VEQDQQHEEQEQKQKQKQEQEEKKEEEEEEEEEEEGSGNIGNLYSTKNTLGVFKLTQVLFRKPENYHSKSTLQ